MPKFFSLHPIRANFTYKLHFTIGDVQFPTSPSIEVMHLYVNETTPKRVKLKLILCSTGKVKFCTTTKNLSGVGRVAG